MILSDEALVSGNPILMASRADAAMGEHYRYAVGVLYGALLAARDNLSCGAYPAGRNNY
ncbi:hypothetical protein ACFSQ7_39475 [Paenibacillus rhizoplanae]